MREILFRGKQVDSGEWVQGFLTKSRNTEEKPALLKFCIDYEEKGVMYSSIVDPETIGQYTGLTDKNGKLIFEGDIIKTKKYGKIVVHSNVNNYDLFAIEYEPAVFRLVNDSRGFNFVGNGTDYEVIGNIYENPKLLKKGE